jgi:hypothetical protein
MEGKEYKSKFDDLVIKNTHDEHVNWMLNLVINKSHAVL